MTPRLKKKLLTLAAITLAGVAFLPSVPEGLRTALLSAASLLVGKEHLPSSVQS